MFRVTSLVLITEGRDRSKSEIRLFDVNNRLTRQGATWLDFSTYLLPLSYSLLEEVYYIYL